MPISHQHRCIFIHVPKCGGTSIEAAFGMHADWRHEDRTRMFGRITSSDLLARGFRSRFLQHLTWRELCSAVPEGERRGYRSFAFVRHPLRRLESAWSRLDHDLVDEARLHGLRLEGASFATFVDRVLRLDHPHVRPQVDYIVGADGAVAVDRLFRFERLADDAREIMSECGVPGRLEHRNPPVRDRAGIAWPEELRQRACERYRDDFAILGYEP
jgi:hypothetical protein